MTHSEVKTQRLKDLLTPIAVGDFVCWVKKHLDKLEGFSLAMKGKVKRAFLNNMIVDIRSLLKRLQLTSPTEPKPNDKE